MKLRFTLTCFLTLYAALVYGTNEKFYSVNSLYGIALREASSLCSDESGFVWASYKTGIIRLSYDDYRLYKIPTQYTNYNVIKLVSHKTNLVAFTNSGQVFKYNRIYDRFEFLLDLRKSIDIGYISINSLLIDDKGHYWFGTTAGVYLYDNGTLRRPNQIVDDINFLSWNKSNQIIGFGNSGLWTFTISSPEKVSFLVQKKALPYQVSILYSDTISGNVWIGTMFNGLFRYNFNGKSLHHILKNQIPNQPILAIESNSDSTLWIGIDGQGVWELNEKRTIITNVFKESADNSYSLNGNGVYDILCDRNKRVWVSTFSGGISFLDQSSPIISSISHTVNNPNSLGNNFINKVIEDSHGNLWFATNNGISKWELSKNRWSTYYHNKKEQAQVFLSLCEDSNGQIWAGTYSSGVYVLDETTGKENAHYYQTKPVRYGPSNFVLDIMRDGQDNLWLGGIQGDIVSYNTKEKKFNYFWGKAINAFIDFSKDKLFYVCTFGLMEIDKKTGSENLLFDGYWLNDGVLVGSNVWLGTRGAGLLCYNVKSKKILRYTTTDGLPSNYVNSVMQIGEFLWLGTETGLCKFSIRSRKVLTYTSLIPWSKISFNPGSRFALRNGNIVWGTTNGAVMFHPDKIQSFKSSGKLFIQDIQVSGRSLKDSSIIHLDSPLDSLQKIRLNYNQNNLLFEFLPLGANVSDNKFTWRLVGLDKEWSQASNRRIITYTNLPSGRFELCIRMYDNSMTYVIDERRISIHLIPPFWKTWWFFIIWFLIFSCIVYFSLRYYIESLKRLHTEEKVKFFTNTAHDLRTALTLINAPIEEIRKDKSLSSLSRYYIQLASEQSKRLLQVSTQLMDFQKVDIGKEQVNLNPVDVIFLIKRQISMFESFALLKDIHLKFSSELSQLITAIDETKMEKVIDNLISNAIKYSPKQSEVHVVVSSENNFWTMVVQDFGIGINRKAQQELFKEFYRGDNAINSKIVGSGIGLMLVRNYVSMHGGTVSCSSTENVGSTFTVVIPLSKPNVETNVYVHENVVEIEGCQTVVAEEVQEHRVAANRDMDILLVEDNDELRHFMRFPLSESFNVSVAEDGAQAWEIIQKDLPDLVVSDVMMPNMDGFELCLKMKSTFETSHIPIILLTSLSEKTEQLHGLGLGADDYLTKPFDISLLSQRIINLIENRVRVREKALKMIESKSEIQIFTNVINDEFVKKAIDVIFENITDPKFNKDQFASSMFVSPSLLYKKIKSLTDQSPIDFIKTIRMNHSLELINSKKYSVTEISEMCGFGSPSYFSTAFKKHFGKSPSDF